MTPYRQALKRLETEFWERLLIETKGNVKEAAKLAGTSRQHAYKVFARLGLKNPVRPTLRGNWGDLAG